MEATITTWTSLLQPFLSIFAQPTAGVFVRLLAGWVLCNGRRTVSGMLRWADPEGVQAHDAYHRFFPDAAWVMDELWRRLALLAVALFYPTGVIPVHLDDTLYHRSGRKVEGAGWWRDAVRSTGTKVVHAWGLNLVVLTIQIIAPWGGEPLGLPILMRLHRKNGPTLTALAEAMLRTLAEWLPERRFLACFDGFYATLAGADLPRTHLISRMRRDAAIYDLPPTHRPKNKRGPKPKRGRRLPAPQQMARQHLPWKRVVTIERGRKKQRLVYARPVIWYQVSPRPVLLVISRDPAGKEEDDFFFTTDLAMKPGEVVGHFADRWCIEDTFKNTKQLLGGQQLQTWKRQGPERAAALSLWLYSMVWLYYLRQKKSQRTFWIWPWYPAKAAPSFADALTSLRRAMGTEKIKWMFGNRAVHDKNYEFLIESLASAA